MKFRDTYEREQIVRSNSNKSYGLPPADTGVWLLNWIANASTFLVHLERRFDPFFRRAFDSLFRQFLTNVTTALINMRRKNEGFKLAEERLQPDEEAHIEDIIGMTGNQMRRLWQAGDFQRGGNTKTHGIVRGEVTIREDLPEHMRRGIFAEPRTYRAWVRFSGPGPYVTPDIDDVGFMSMSIKLMGVPGPKLMYDEKFTQDLFGTSVPTFVCPDTRTNARLQHWSVKNAPLVYFINFPETRLLDGVMNLLWTKTQTCPLGVQYLSRVPHLLGHGQAIHH